MALNLLLSIYFRLGERVLATPLRKQDYLQVKDYNRSPQQQVIKYKQNKRTTSIQKKRSKKKFR